MTGRSYRATAHCMMAVAILYFLPPTAVLYGLRRFTATDLTAGSTKE